MDGGCVHVAFLLLVLVAGPGLAQDRTDTEPKDQYGDINCILNDDGIIEATFFVVKNNSRITRVYFSYDNFTEYEGDDCQFNGTGDLSDPFTTTLFIDPKTDMPPTGRDYCGHSVLVSGDTYEWRVYTQRLENFHMDGNVVFVFSCNTLPSNISVTLENLGREVIELPSTIGSITLLMLSAASPTGTLLTSINIGNDYFPTLRFQPSSVTSPNVDIDLSPWGAYCERLFVAPEDTPQRRVEMLDPTGCPTPGRGFDGSFIGTKPAVGAIYYSHAGPLEAWRFDKTPQYPQASSNTLHFTCHARLCWRPDDTKCIDRCNTTVVRKRSTDELEQLYLVTGQMTMTEEEEVTEQTDVQTTPTTATTTENKGPVGQIVYIISGVCGAVIILFLLIVVCCLIRRQHRRKSKFHNYLENTSISSSTVAMADKMDGRGPRFQFRGKY